MRRIDVLLTSEIAGGQAPFGHDSLSVRFHIWSGSGAPPATLPGSRLLVFIDWSLPGIAGVELCRRIRCNPDTAAAEIVIVLESDHPDDRRRAVRAGASDCVLGPLSRTAILDRIMAMPASANESGEPQRLSLGELVVDSAAFQARWQGKAIPLMPNELRLLRFLVAHPGRVFTRAQLIEALGKQDPPIDERTVDVWIGRLRRALRRAGANDPLRTVRGMGYVLDLPELG